MFQFPGYPTCATRGNLKSQIPNTKQEVRCERCETGNEARSEKSRILTSHINIQLPTSTFTLQRCLFGIWSLEIGISRNRPARDGTGLRSRLTPHRRPLCGKPWVFGARHSQPDFVTHSGILTPTSSTPPYGVSFTTGRTLPYPLRIGGLEFRRLA